MFSNGKLCYCSGEIGYMLILVETLLLLRLGFLFLLKVLSCLFFLLVYMFIYQLWFVRLTCRSMFELFAIAIEVIWCSVYTYDSKHLTIPNTIFYQFKTF